MPDWNPDQYLRFAKYRLQPAHELLQRIPLDSAKVIVDLGCGAGNITRMIEARWPSAIVYGVDNSSAMLERAQSEPSNILWVQADIRHWQLPTPVDLIYSNAALQWTDDHEKVFKKLICSLRPHGYLAIQMPLSWNLPSHRLMRDTLECFGKDDQPLAESRLRTDIGKCRVETAEFYYTRLTPFCSSLEIWTTEYLHTLTGDNPVYEWVKATGLRPILQALTDDELSAYVEKYKRRLCDAYPKRADGITLYPFPRLFILARSL